MLQSILINDIVLIRQLQVALDGGLSVLTGETGAGKSILLDSLALALGGRGDGGLVRQGCQQGQVRAVFELDVVAAKAIQSRLVEQGIDFDGQLILRRVQNADGRTRAWINDVSVSATTLREIGQHLVEIHGQHDERALVDSGLHRDLLTSFGGLEENAAELTVAYDELKKIQGQLASHVAAVRKAEEEADYLRDSVAELTQLAPELGEEEELAARRTNMMAAEKIASDLNEAQQALTGSVSPSPALASVIRMLERKADTMPQYLPAVIEALDAAIRNIDEASAHLSGAIEQTRFDPAELEGAEERLFALRAASRKFSVAVENLPELAVTMAANLQALDAGAEELTRLEKLESEARGVYYTLARELADRRAHAAAALSEAVIAELPELKLGDARFLVEISRDDERISADGIDSAEFWVQTNPSTKAGPMMKVASGGELSRFLLALKVALADRCSAPTLVFDEIDTGVGGAVADAIGARLAKLSKRVQVLSVTHAPQVAARASQHLLISKKTGEGDADTLGTRVHEMTDNERREEIARMLSGASVSEEARAAADKLLGV